MEHDIKFKGDNPGAVRFGNFINYYKFHPVANRLNLFPKHVWKTEEKLYLGLDIGCNAGDFTIALLRFIEENITNKNTICNLLGIDVDPTLIQRAKEHNNTDRIQYECLDIMTDTHLLNINSYLKQFNYKRFDVTFCLSVTMWIHLNHGDDGLKALLRRVSDVSELLVIEPQPWKCYKSALKRMRLANADFPLLKQLKIRENVEGFIEQFLEHECDLVSLFKTDCTSWNRRFLFYCKKGSKLLE